MRTLHDTPRPDRIVAVFGEMLADIFPDARVLGGAPYNMARHLQALGLEPLMISRIGDDAIGAELLEEMHARGMNRHGVQRDPARPTGQVRVVLGQHGHRFDILPDQAYDHICAKTARASLAGMEPAIAYFGTLVQRSPASHAAAMDFLQRCRCRTFLDINLRPPWVDNGILAASLAAADILKLNAEELVEVAERLHLGASTPIAQAQELQQRYAIAQIVVTCGADGSWLLDENSSILRATPARDAPVVVDTVGAGDAYAAVIILGLLSGWDAPTRLQRADEYAAAQCGIRGAAPLPQQALRPFLENWAIA